MSSFVLLSLCYALTFAGLTLQPIGWLYLALWIAGILLILPLGRAEFKPSKLWAPRWPFRPGVPGWVKSGSLAILAFWICQAVLYASASQGGQPEILDGDFVLLTRNVMLRGMTDQETVRRITQEQYGLLFQMQTRLGLLKLILLWFQATAFWWLQYKKTQRTSGVMPRLL